MAKKSFGVIGGGVSGLAVAYEIRRNALASKTECQIHLFEKHPVIGGNADTVVVNLGNRVDGKGKSKAYHRWADLGVNDINLAAYHRIEKIMKEIDYFDRDNPKLNKTMLPLENTETYFTWDNEVLLTDDRDLEKGVSDPAFSMATMYEGHFLGWIDVVHKAADAAAGKPEDPNLETTVEQFFDRIIANPEKELKQYADDKPSPPWDDPELKRLLGEIRDHVFYPRISAMYFANDEGSENMLLAAPMCYYRIQESKGGSEPDRRYFVGGSARWLKALLDNLLDRKKGKGLVEIEMHTDFPARASVAADQVVIRNANDPKSEFKVDQCVVTVHADDAAALLSFDRAAGPSTDGEAVTEMLESISYTHSFGACHSYSGMMPANRNQWRAYNVLIRKDNELKPYNMTYLSNRHQNDAGEQQSERYDYNRMGLPQYFVTLNPLRDIPEQYILKTVDPADVAEELRADLPRLREESTGQPRYGRLSAGQPATAEFKHNLIDKKCFTAQKTLVKYHQSAKTLFFAGGWSLGSGLHEECWHQAENVARLVMPLKK